MNAPLGVVAVVAAAASCAPARGASTEIARWEYVVTPPVAGDAIVRVEATLPAVPRLVLPADARKGIASLEQRTASGWRTIAPGDDGWTLGECTGRCEVRYAIDRGALEAACDGDMDCGIDVGGATISTVSRWLVRPAHGEAVVTLRVAGDAPFAFGMKKTSPRTFEFRASELGEGSYTAFGTVRLVHARDVDVAIAGGGLAMGDEATVRWIDDATGAVSRFYGRFPTPATIFLLPIPGEAEVRFGSVMALTGASIAVFVGADLPERATHDDWVVVHELTHLGAPTFVGEGRWLEEGIATYFEPIERARAGWISQAELWSHFGASMPRGVRAPSSPPDIEDRHDVSTTYWGGALFLFAADVAIREQTHGAHRLDDVLRACLEKGGDVTHIWKVHDFLSFGDEVTGTRVLSDLAESFGERGEPIDLAALLTSLGVSWSEDRGVTLRDDAPRAAIRRAIGAR